MTFAREKRLLIGWLALLAPLPLPFNELLSFPLLALYMAAVTAFLWRARRDDATWLPTWAMNLLGLAYVPVLVLDVRRLAGGQVVLPVVHLLLFAAVVKLFGMERERDKWQTLIAVFFLFLAAMATSVHPSVLLYLVAFLSLGMLLLARLAFFHLVAGYGVPSSRVTLPSMRRFLALATGATLLAAAPFFFFLPRIRGPYLTGVPSGLGTLGESTGFSSTVTLDSIGGLRQSPEVVLRLRYERPPGSSAALYFRASAHDLFRGNSWLEVRERPERLERAPGALDFELAPGTVTSWATVWLRPVAASYLVLPAEARRVSVAADHLNLGRRGTVELPKRPRGVVEYRVGLGPRAVSWGREPGFEGEDGTLDLEGVGDEVRALAASVAGTGSAAERARRLELFLLTEYEYSTDFVGRAGERPIEDFLFKFKTGHCEYFASALVLLLRAQGIPAQLTTGFFGAEFNPLEGYYIVREWNAHAWVEAYIPGQGWRIFDPTPPAGRPMPPRTGVLAIFGQAYDFLVFRWDRDILTYGFGDQLRLLLRVRDLWSDFWEQLRGKRRPTTPRSRTSPAPEPAPSAGAPGAAGEGGSAGLTTALPVALVLLLLLGWLLRRQRRPPTGEAAYGKLRRWLARRGLALSPATPPVALARASSDVHQGAANPARRIVGLYLEESFRGRALSQEERLSLRAALAELAALKRPG